MGFQMLREIMVSRKIKEFVEIKDYTSLDALVEKLIEVRDHLPPDAEPELKMKGDDVFGRLLSISYFRPQTPEEAECEERYAAAYRESRFRTRALSPRPVQLRSAA